MRKPCCVALALLLSVSLLVSTSWARPRGGFARGAVGTRAGSALSGAAGARAGASTLRNTISRPGATGLGGAAGTLRGAAPTAGARLPAPAGARLPAGVGTRPAAAAGALSRPGVGAAAAARPGLTAGAGALAGAAATPRAAAAAFPAWASARYKPFSAAWYAQHPRAFQLTHPHADALAAATAVGLARWLGVAAVPVPGQTVVSSEYAVPSTTVVVEEPVSTTDSTEFASPAAAAPPATAPDSGQWMNIGSYVLLGPGQTQGTRLMQLAVRPDGLLQGTHYDVLTEQVAQINGSVDKQTLRASWRMGPQSQVIFEAALGELTQPQGKVTARYPDGTSQTWQVVQITQ